jgi:DNA-binding LacI/PurR family transcriptional regulator
MALELQIERTDPSHKQIQTYLRQQIRAGALKQGERLPSNMELARKWGVSCTAVQRALATLTSEGLLARAPRRGTYVRPSTEKASIGVLFGPSLSDECAHFYRAVLQSLRTESDKHGWTCRAYDGLTAAEGRTESQSAHVRQHFLQDLTNCTFKGAIIISPELRWLQELTRRANLPFTVWHSSEISDVEFDWYRFGWDIAHHAANQGRRRLAYLRSRWHQSKETDDLDGLLDAVRELGLPQPRIESMELTGQAGQEEREAFQRAMRLMREWNDRDPNTLGPDALLVNDDIVMRAVAMALMQVRIAVPERLLVYSQANDGVAIHYGLPVARYEFSTREIAQQLLGLLAKRIMGEPLPDLPFSIRGRLKEATA